MTDSGVPPDGPFGAWALEAAEGNPALAAAANTAVSRFHRLYGSFFMLSPAPGFSAAVRVFRGLAAMSADGRVMSAELFHIRHLDEFLASPAERAAAMAEASWDGKAALFCHRQPPRRTREAPPLIDYTGGSLARLVPDMVRYAEMMLNRDLRRHPMSERILEPDRGGHRQMRPHIREAFAALAGPLAATEAAAALDAFRGALDRTRLLAMDAAGINSVAAYNWLGGHDGLGSAREAGLRRTQAVTAYPLAWPAISAPTGAVAEAVEQARPLVPVLAAAFGIREVDARRMNGLGIEAAGLEASPDSVKMAEIARAVGRMPPGNVPATTSGWKAFFRSVKLADAVSVLLGGGPEGAEREKALLASAAGKWDGLDPDAISQAAGGLRDMVTDVHVSLLEPCADRFRVAGWTMRKTLLAIMGDRTLAQVAASSAWWHGEQARIHAGLAGAFPFSRRSRRPGSWPPLHEGGAWHAACGLTVVPLISESMLAEEHRRMGHCVNGYAGQCLYGGSHILSIRTADGKSLATVEFCQEDILELAGTLSEPPDVPLTQMPPGTVQFQGHHNTVPEIRAWEALWDYASAILTGSLGLKAEELRAELEMRRHAMHGRSEVRACYDVAAPGALEAAWGHYRQIFPKSTARRGPEAALGIRPAPGPENPERAAMELR